MPNLLRTEFPQVSGQESFFPILQRQLLLSSDFRSNQYQIHNLQDPVQSKNAKILVQKLLRISKQWEQSIKSSVRYFWVRGRHKSQVHEACSGSKHTATPYLVADVPLSTHMIRTGTHFLDISVWRTLLSTRSPHWEWVSNAYLITATRKLPLK